MRLWFARFIKPWCKPKIEVTYLKLIWYERQTGGYTMSVTSINSLQPANFIFQSYCYYFRIIQIQILDHFQTILSTYYHIFLVNQYRKSWIFQSASRFSRLHEMNFICDSWINLLFLYAWYSYICFYRSIMLFVFFSLVCLLCNGMESFQKLVDIMEM